VENINTREVTLPTWATFFIVGNSYFNMGQPIVTHDVSHLKYFQENPSELNLKVFSIFVTVQVLFRSF